jgi:hypothetical protein
MAIGEDWLGWTIFVFIIAAIIISIIKVFIEYPGLTGLKCVYNEDLEDSKHVVEDDDVKSIHRDKKKMMRYKMRPEQELLEGTENGRRYDLSRTCCDKDKVSKNIVTIKKEKTIPDTIPSKIENVKPDSDSVKVEKFDENPDEIRVIIENESVQLKKKVSFNMTCEKQAKITDDKQGKIASSENSKKHWSSLQFIPRRQDGSSRQSS